MRLRAECARLGFSYWVGRPFDLFVFGVRSPVSSTNLFDDVIGVAYVDALGEERVELFAATTDPGRKALNAPMHPGGTATVVPGQYRRVWTAGLHRGKYRALVQRPGETIPVFRGLDRKRVHLDARGINLHHAAGASRVDWYSAGCLVVRDPAALARILYLYDRQVEAGHGESVSCTLFDAAASPSLGGLTWHTQ